MLSKKLKEKPGIKIGELLVQAGLIHEETINAALSLATRMRVPLGRILSMEGHISEPVLQAGLELQSRIADKLIDVDLGVRTLSLLAKKGLTLEAALERAAAGETVDENDAGDGAPVSAPPVMQPALASNAVPPLPAPDAVPMPMAPASPSGSALDEINAIFGDVPPAPHSAGPVNAAPADPRAVAPPVVPPRADVDASAPSKEPPMLPGQPTGPGDGDFAHVGATGRSIDETAAQNEAAKSEMQATVTSPASVPSSFVEQPAPAPALLPSPELPHSSSPVSANPPAPASRPMTAIPAAPDHLVSAQAPPAPPPKPAPMREKKFGAFGGRETCFSLAAIGTSISPEPVLQETASKKAPSALVSQFLIDDIDASEFMDEEDEGAEDVTDTAAAARTIDEDAAIDSAKSEWEHAVEEAADPAGEQPEIEAPAGETRNSLDDLASELDDSEFLLSKPEQEAASPAQPVPAAVKASVPPVPAGTTNRLGDLLVSAGIIDVAHLDKALIHGKRTGLPLGAVLVGMGLINHSLLNNALTAQQLIRSEEVPREKALHALKAAQLRCQSIHKSLENYDWYARTTILAVDLGELLNIAGILSTDELLTTRQLELVEEKPFDEIVTARGFADEKFVCAAKQLLAMVEEGTLFEDQAALILRRLKSVEGEPVPDFLLSLLDADHMVDEIGLRELIEEAGLMSLHEMEAACALSLSNKAPLIKTLHDSGLLENWQLQGVLRCKEFIDAGVFEPEQAIIGLLYSLEKRMAYDEAIYAFGWSLPLQMAG